MNSLARSFSSLEQASEGRGLGYWVNLITVRGTNLKEFYAELQISGYRCFDPLIRFPLHIAGLPFLFYSCMDPICNVWGGGGVAGGK